MVSMELHTWTSEVATLTGEMSLGRHRADPTRNARNSFSRVE
jgi:hypothetical protein